MAGDGRQFRIRCPLRVLKYDPARPQDFVFLYKASPFAQATQFDLVRELIEREKLGQGGGVDYLMVAPGSTDLLGYDVGAESPLIDQMVLHLDREIEQTAGHLEQAVGAGNYVVVFTAAHGGPAAQPRSAPGRRSGGPRHREEPGRASSRASPWIVTSIPSSTCGRPPPSIGGPVRAAAGQAALQVPGVAGYFTADGDCSHGGEWFRRFRNSFHPVRSGDVMLSYAPGWVEDFGTGRGVSYGSLYNYDCRVPLIFYGPQFRSRTFEEPVEAIDVAPTIARLTGIGYPSSATGRVLGEAFIARRRVAMSDPGGRLATSLCGIPLRNPVLAASGTFGYGVEFESLVDLESLGGIVVKGLSREPMEGNPPPRLWETRAGMINSVGLQNIGVCAFVKEKLPRLAQFRTPVFANIFGYADRGLRGSGARAGIGRRAGRIRAERLLPQHEARRDLFLERSGAACRSGERGAARWRRRPLIVKLSPNVAAIEPLAKAAEDAGADADLAGEHVRSAGDRCAHPPAADRRGLRRTLRSGHQADRLRMVYQAAQAVKIPVIGIGGIATGEDAAEFLIAGASAVEVGTARFWDPASVARIAKELDAFLSEQNGGQRARDRGHAAIRLRLRLLY